MVKKHIYSRWLQIRSHRHQSSQISHSCSTNAHNHYQFLRPLRTPHLSLSPPRIPRTASQQLLVASHSIVDDGFSDLKPRNSTWLHMADLLFVDNPVGTGYSFVEDTKLLVKTDEEAATDLTTLLMKIFNRNASLQKSPLYIVAESYGGKYDVTLALSALKAFDSEKLKLKFGGCCLAPI